MTEAGAVRSLLGGKESICHIHKSLLHAISLSQHFAIKVHKQTFAAFKYNDCCRCVEVDSLGHPDHSQCATGSANLKATYLPHKNVKYTLLPSCMHIWTCLCPIESWRAWIFKVQGCYMRKKNRFTSYQHCRIVQDVRLQICSFKHVPPRAHTERERERGERESDRVLIDWGERQTDRQKMGRTY